MGQAPAKDGEPWDGNTQDWLNGYGQQASAFDTALGTIGGGNHFAELQKVERILDQQALAALGVDPHRLILLVHSGSRGLGEAILREHVERYRGGRRGLANRIRFHDPVRQNADLSFRKKSKGEMGK